MKKITSILLIGLLLTQLLSGCAKQSDESILATADAVIGEETVQETASVSEEETAEAETSEGESNSSSDQKVEITLGFSETVEELIRQVLNGEGTTAYDIAVKNGFEGTEAQWLASLAGEDGQSPYIQNGTWWVGDSDTGVPASGERGVTDEAFQAAIQELQAAAGSYEHIQLILGTLLLNTERYYFGAFAESAANMTHANIAHYEFPVSISIDWSKYRLRIFKYSQEKEYDDAKTQSYCTGFTTYSSDLVLEANTYFRIVVLPRNNTTALTYAEQEEICRSLTVYGLSGSSIKDSVQELVQITENIQNYDPLYDSPYVYAEIQRLESALKEKAALGNTVVFGFNTDQHIRTSPTIPTANSRPTVFRGLRALSILTQRYPFDFLCLGGDAVGYYSDTPDEMLADIIDVNSCLTDAACPVVSIAGNHDAYQKINGIEIKTTAAQRYHVHMKRLESNPKISTDGQYTNAVYDAASHKIRFIFLDSYTTEEYSKDYMTNWLSTALETKPQGYQCVILSHLPLCDYPGYSDATGLRDVMKAYAEDIICCVHGHLHADVSTVQDGILFIGVTNSGLTASLDADYGGTPAVKTVGTAAETAQDIFVIDQENQRIYTLRYGAGCDREFDYNSASPTFGQIS